MNSKPIKFAFWGTSEFSVYVLDSLKESGFLPALIVSTPDKPQGRKLEIKPTLTKNWAQEDNVPILQPEKLDDEFYQKLTSENWDVFVVTSYGKIIPERFLNIPNAKTLNVHPSLLPKLRGPAPIETAILKDIKDTGVSIMRLDKEMDHGPIIVQEKYMVNEWPTREELEKKLGEIGGKLLAKIIPDWIAGKIEEKEQNHSLATFSKKIQKQDAQLDLSADPYENFRKIKAYSGWPNAFFFIQNNGKQIRVTIKDVRFENSELKITRVIPEGKKEMDYEDFMRGLK